MDLERERGITIMAKKHDDSLWRREVTIVDTRAMRFAAEVERELWRWWTG